MASGIINGTTSNDYISVSVEWFAVANGPSANTSTVKAALYYRRTNTGYTTYGTGTFSLTINGTATSATKELTIGTSWVKAVEATVTVPHNSNGTKSITISASGSLPGTTLTSSSVSSKVTLDTIPRASTLDSLSCATTYFDGKMTYKYTTKSASFYNRCNITLTINGTYYAIKSIDLGATTSPRQVIAYVTLSESELSTLYSKLPSATKGVLLFTLRTYSDSKYTTQIGDATYKELTLRIPNNTNTQPTATMTLTPVNPSSLHTDFSSLYIAGMTKLDADFTNEEGKYGASIVSYSMSVDGKSYGGEPFTSDYLTTTGNLTVTGIVTNSRQFSRKYTKSITVLPYAAPTLLPMSNENEIICARCDANGEPTESGTYLKIKAKRSYSKVVSDGVQKNFCQIRYRYQPEGGTYSSWETILADNALNTDEVDTVPLLGGTLSATTSYRVQVGVIDKIGGSYNLTFRISTEKVYMHRAGSKNSLGIGKYAEDENVVDVAQDITAIFRGDVQFMGEAWISRALGTNVTASTVNSGRWGGSGVYYRVCAGGKHVYVAFNVSFTTSASTVRAESETIPFAPNYDVYALCPVGFANGQRGIATVSVSPKGRVNIYAVHKLPGATLSTGETVAWIDGYIDYWS